MCLYESHDTNETDRQLGLVCWYIFASEIDNKHNPKRCDFDKNNEIVQDLRKTENVIKLKHIKKKCNVIFALEDDPVEYIKGFNGNKSIYFFCRYKIEMDFIEPIFSEDNVDLEGLTIFGLKEFIEVACTPEKCNKLSKNYERTPENSKRTSNKRYVKKCKGSPKKLKESHEIPSSTEKLTKYYLNKLKDEFLGNEKVKEENKVKRKNEIKNSNTSTPPKLLKLSPVHSTPDNLKKKHSVKRNLNHSFECETSPLNYSVVDIVDDLEENNIKLKLRVSLKTPVVKLKRFKESDLSNFLEESPKKKRNVDYSNRKSNVGDSSRESEEDSNGKSEEDPNKKNEEKVRRSKRTVERKSYADFISPIKNRRRSQSVDSETNSSVKLNRINRRRSKSQVAIIISSEDESDVEKSNEKKGMKNKSRCSIAIEKCFIEGLCVDGNIVKESPMKILNRNCLIRKSILKTSCENVTPKKKVSYYKDEICKRSEKSFTACVREDSTETPPLKKTPRKETPGSRLKLLREGVITPSFQKREKALEKVDTPLSKARRLLHVSYVPTLLPCRENEFLDVFQFIEGKLSDGCGG